MNEILPFMTTKMDPEGFMLSGIRQTENEICDFTYIYINKKQTQTKNTENTLMVARGEGEGMSKIGEEE